MATLTTDPRGQAAFVEEEEDYDPSLLSQAAPQQGGPRTMPFNPGDLGAAENVLAPQAPVQAAPQQNTSLRNLAPVKTMPFLANSPGQAGSEVLNILGNTGARLLTDTVDLGAMAIDAVRAASGDMSWDEVGTDADNPLTTWRRSTFKVETQVGKGVNTFASFAAVFAPMGAFKMVGRGLLFGARLGKGVARAGLGAQRLAQVGTRARALGEAVKSTRAVQTLGRIQDYGKTNAFTARFSNIDDAMTTANRLGLVDPKIKGVLTRGATTGEQYAALALELGLKKRPDAAFLERAIGTIPDLIEVAIKMPWKQKARTVGDLMLRDAFAGFVLAGEGDEAFDEPFAAPWLADRNLGILSAGARLLVPDYQDSALALKGKMALEGSLTGLAFAPFIDMARIAWMGRGFRSAPQAAKEQYLQLASQTGNFTDYIGKAAGEPPMKSLFSMDQLRQMVTDARGMNASGVAVQVAQRQVQARLLKGQIDFQNPPKGFGGGGFAKAGPGELPPQFAGDPWEQGGALATVSKPAPQRVPGERTFTEGEQAAPVPRWGPGMQPQRGPTFPDGDGQAPEPKWGREQQAAYFPDGDGQAPEPKWGQPRPDNFFPQGEGGGPDPRFMGGTDAIAQSAADQRQELYGWRAGLPPLQAPAEPMVRPTTIRAAAINKVAELLDAAPMTEENVLKALDTVRADVIALLPPSRAGRVDYVQTFKPAVNQDGVVNGVDAMWVNETTRQGLGEGWARISDNFEIEFNKAEAMGLDELDTIDVVAKQVDEAAGVQRVLDNQLTAQAAADGPLAAKAEPGEAGVMPTQPMKASRGTPISDGLGQDLNTLTNAVGGIVRDVDDYTRRQAGRLDAREAGLRAEIADVAAESVQQEELGKLQAAQLNREVSTELVQAPRQQRATRMQQTEIARRVSSGEVVPEEELYAAFPGLQEYEALEQQIRAELLKDRKKWGVFRTVKGDEGQRYYEDVLGKKGDVELKRRLAEAGFSEYPGPVDIGTLGITALKRIAKAEGLTGAARYTSKDRGRLVREIEGLRASLDARESLQQSTDAIAASGMRMGQMAMDAPEGSITRAFAAEGARGAIQDADRFGQILGRGLNEVDEAAGALPKAADEAVAASPGLPVGKANLEADLAELALADVMEQTYTPMRLRPEPKMTNAVMIELTLKDARQIDMLKEASVLLPVKIPPGSKPRMGAEDWKAVLDELTEAIDSGVMQGKDLQVAKRLQKNIGKVLGDNAEVIGDVAERESLAQQAFNDMIGQPNCDILG